MKGGAFKGKIISNETIFSLKRIKIDGHEEIQRSKNEIYFKGKVNKGREGLNFKTNSSNIRFNLSYYNATGKLTKLYDGEIKYADNQLDRIFEELKGENLTNDTLVVIMADHGEALWDHRNHGHGKALYESGVRVPFILKYDEFEPQTINKHVRTIDALPTILDILNIKTELNPQGKSLLPMIKGKGSEKSIFLERRYYSGSQVSEDKKYGIRNGNWKFILSKNKINGKTSIKEELYQIEKDPGELNNLASKREDLVKKFRSKIKSYLNSERNKDEFYHEYDKKTEEMLRDLGYIE